jgi:hypothetical protein
MKSQFTVRKLIAVCALALGSLTPATAQGFPPAAAPPWVYADNFGRWSIQLQTPSTYTFSPTSTCYFTQLNYSGKQFYAFSNAVALAPVFVQDANSANSEVVTPGSYQTPTSTTCGVNISPSNSHKINATLNSGSGGLQEAINAIGASTAPYQTTIILSQEWYKLIASIYSQNATLAASYSPAQVIANATCSTNVQLLDVTANPWAAWNCNPSTNKFSLSTIAVKASVAAGAGAGTGPTIALNAGSTWSSGTVTLTTGTTPTASAAIFTLTFTAPNSGGPAYSPVCSVVSIGSPAYTSGTVSYTAGSGGTAATAILTASSTALTASQAGYAWRYTCH